MESLEVLVSRDGKAYGGVRGCAKARPVLVLAGCGSPGEYDTTWQRVTHDCRATWVVWWRGECYDDADEFVGDYVSATGATEERALELWAAHATECLALRAVPADGWPEGSVVDDAG